MRDVGNRPAQRKNRLGPTLKGSATPATLQRSQRELLGLQATRPEQASIERPRVTKHQPTASSTLDLTADSLWQQGPEAVAEAMYAMWVDIGEPNDWDSDERLWDTVFAELEQQ